MIKKIQEKAKFALDFLSFFSAWATLLSTIFLMVTYVVDGELSKSTLWSIPIYATLWISLSPVTIWIEENWS